MLLSSTIEKQLQKVEQHLIHGEFQKALSKIEAEIAKEGMSNEYALMYKALQCEISTDLGKYEKALELADEVLRGSKRSENILIQIDVLIHKALALQFGSGKLNEPLNCVEKGLKLLDSISKSISSKDYAKRKAWLLQRKGGIVFNFGDYVGYLKLRQESLSFAEESGNMRVIARCLSGLGLSYIYNNDYKKSDECFLKAKVVAKEIGNKLELYIANLWHAMLKSNQNHYTQAIDLFEKALSLLKETNSTLMLNFLYNDLGMCYRGLFQYDKAIAYFKKALKESNYVPVATLGNIGYSYFLSYDFEQAKKYFLQSMQISKKTDEKRVLAGVLYFLILITIEMKNLSEAQQYLEQLEKISKETGFEYLNQTYQYALILALKGSGILRDLVRASELLNEFLRDDSLSLSRRLDALYTLLEIYVKDLILSATQESLSKVKKQLIRLEVEAEEQRYEWLLANVYRLQSQIALIEFDAKKAMDLLQKAQIIAEKINIQLLKNNILADREKIKQQLSMLQELQEQDATLVETLKQVPLEDDLKHITKETSIEIRDEKSGEIIEYRKLFALKI